MDTKFAQECYNKNYVLTGTNEIILEAKRVLLNEQLEKIANITLSHLNNKPLLPETVKHECQNNLDWNNYIQNNLLIFQDETVNSISSSDDLQVQKSEIPKPENAENMQNSEYQLRLTKKYFELWKTAISLRKREKEMIVSNETQEEKLEAFIKTLQKIKTKEHLQKSENFERNFGKSRSCYKNRFMVQKNIINMQKSKLEEQSKIIEELKLGIIREDILKSIENTRINLREIFAGCSDKIKCKLPALHVEENTFNVSIQKAPKIIQQMEERALQRAKNREIILERKKVIEGIRQKMLEEAIEKKKVLEEEDRKRNLEIMKENRRKELEIERIRQEKRKVYEEKLKTSVNFHNKLLKEQCLKKLYNNLILSREKEITAIEHYRKKVLRESLNNWINLVDSLYIVKYETADAHFTYKILKKCMNTWNEVCKQSIQNMQVAEDLYDFRLTSNIFLNWHRYVCKEIMLESKKIKNAEKLYERRLVFHYFYQWRSLKAVLELEKAKELKKQKWRKKVWEILPDYKPPEDF